MLFGAVAQLGERLLCKQEVVGSIPSGSTIVFDNRLRRGRIRARIWVSLCPKVFREYSFRGCFQFDLEMRTGTTLLKIVNMILAFIDWS